MFYVYVLHMFWGTYEYMCVLLLLYYKPHSKFSSKHYQWWYYVNQNFDIDMNNLNYMSDNIIGIINIKFRDKFTN